jgi:hypothetical protein
MPDAPRSRNARVDILLIGSPGPDTASTSPSVSLIRTSGHSAEDISTVVGTPEGVVVFTHLWWTDAMPLEDPYAPDPALLHAPRARVLAFADRIVPAHGAPFSPSAATPR